MYALAHIGQIAYLVGVRLRPGSILSFLICDLCVAYMSSSGSCVPFLDLEEYFEEYDLI